MNGNTSSELIDEGELRSALELWRTDRNSFAVEVQQRIEQAEWRSPPTYEPTEVIIERSQWLQTAAAVIPVPLVGKGVSGGLVKIGQLSVSSKLIAFAALPATGLLLMVGASIWAIIKVRHAARNQPTNAADATDAGKLSEVTAGWWKQYGAAMAILSSVMLLLVLAGYMLPILVMFLVSGTAMVALISRLGQAGLVDRRTIAGTLGPGLIMLVQLTHTATMFSQGYPFLDQHLIPTVLLLGGLVVLLACDWPLTQANPKTWWLSLGLLVIGGWFSASLWNPVSTRQLKNYVESFDQAQHASASWQQWQVVAQWLHDTKMPVDLSKPYGLLQVELTKKKPNPWVLCFAMEGDAMQEQDIHRLPDLARMKKRLFDHYNREQPLVSLGYEPRQAIRAMVCLDQLTEEDRDFIGARLAATMESLKHKNYGRLLEDQLIVTKLAALIQRPLDIDNYREFVHQSLVSHQRLNHRLGVTSGGFTMSKELNFSDQYATAAAIELMQLYGVPSAVRIDALRSYLRPSANHLWFGALRGQTYVRNVCLRRLQSLPEVSSITWIDYLRYEQNLLMAILFTGVCVFATFGAAAKT